MPDSILTRIPVVAGVAYIERVRRLPSTFEATLTAEPDNRYFRHAIVVSGNGEKVGYVAPEVAVRYFEGIKGLEGASAARHGGLRSRTARRPASSCSSISPPCRCRRPNERQRPCVRRPCLRPRAAILRRARAGAHHPARAPGGGRAPAALRRAGVCGAVAAVRSRGRHGGRRVHERPLAAGRQSRVRRVHRPHPRSADRRGLRARRPDDGRSRLRVDVYEATSRGWDYQRGTLRIDGEAEPLLSRERDRVSLAINSFSTPDGGRRAPLVDVGAGTDADFAPPRRRSRGRSCSATPPRPALAAGRPPARRHRRRLDADRVATSGRPTPRR
jgi:hypothetical protein